MNGKTITGAIGALAATLCAMTTSAQAEDKLSYFLTLQGVSEYNYRGFSYSNETPAAQAYLEFDYNIFYLAFFGSGTNYLDTYGPYEFDTFFGVRPVTGPITWDFGVLYYTWGSQSPAVKASDLDYFEFKAGASVTPITNLNVSLTAYHTPKQDTAVADTTTVEGNVAYTLPQVGIFVPTISGLVGWSTSEKKGNFLGDDEYTYWNGGVKLAVDKYFMDFRYIDTTIDNRLTDARFLFTAGINLP